MSQGCVFQFNNYSTTNNFYQIQCPANTKLQLFGKKTFCSPPHSKHFLIVSPIFVISENGESGWKRYTATAASSSTIVQQQSTTSNVNQQKQIGTRTNVNQQIPIKTNQQELPSAEELSSTNCQAEPTAIAITHWREKLHINRHINVLTLMRSSFDMNQISCESQLGCLQTKILLTSAHMLFCITDYCITD